MNIVDETNNIFIGKLQYHQYKLSISCTICTIMYNLVQYTVDCQNIVSPDKN